MYTAHEIAPTGSDDARVAPKAPVCLRQAPGTSRQAPGTSPMQQHRGFRQLRPPTVSFSSRRARPGTQLGFPGSVGESSAGLNLDSLWKAAAVTGCSARRWASGPSAGPSFSAAAPPARRRWPRPAAAQAQKYGPMPETEPRQLRGVETKRGAKVPAQAGQEKKRGFFRIDGRLGPSKPSPAPLSPTHTHSVQHAYRSARLAPQAQGPLLCCPRVTQPFPACRCPGREGRGWQLGKLPEGSYRGLWWEATGKARREGLWREVRLGRRLW